MQSLGTQGHGQEPQHQQGLDPTFDQQHAPWGGDQDEGPGVVATGPGAGAGAGADEPLPSSTGEQPPAIADSLGPDDSGTGRRPSFC